MGEAPNSNSPRQVRGWGRSFSQPQGLSCLYHKIIHISPRHIWGDLFQTPGSCKFLSRNVIFPLLTSPGMTACRAQSPGCLAALSNPNICKAQHTTLSTRTRPPTRAPRLGGLRLWSERIHLEGFEDSAESRAQLLMTWP